LTANDYSDEFEGIPEGFRRLLSTLTAKDKTELLEKLRLYMNEKPSKEVIEQFEVTRKRIAEIEIKALKKRRGKGSSDEN
jgi:DNA-directed RNA polymerase sigma subunit (sigma70/sigma32)